MTSLIIPLPFVLLRCLVIFLKMFCKLYINGTVKLVPTPENGQTLKQIVGC